MTPLTPGTAGGVGSGGLLVLRAVSLAELRGGGCCAAGGGLVADAVDVGATGTEERAACVGGSVVAACCVAGGHRGGAAAGAAGAAAATAVLAVWKRGADRWTASRHRKGISRCMAVASGELLIVHNAVKSRHHSEAQA